MPISREVITPKNDILNVSRSRSLPHSPGIRVGDFIFLSGMVSIDPQTGELSLGTVAHERTIGEARVAVDRSAGESDQDGLNCSYFTRNAPTVCAPIALDTPGAVYVVARAFRP